MERKNGVQQVAGFLIFAELEEVEKHDDDQNTDSSAENAEQDGVERVDVLELSVDTVSGERGETIEGTHDFTLPMVVEETMDEPHREGLVGRGGDIPVGTFGGRNGEIARSGETIFSFHRVRSDIFDVDESVGLTVSFVEVGEFFRRETGQAETSVDCRRWTARTRLDAIGDVEIPPIARRFDWERFFSVSDLENVVEVGPVRRVVRYSVRANEASEIIRGLSQLLRQFSCNGGILGSLFGFVHIVKEKSKNANKSNKDNNLKSHCNVSCSNHVFFFFLFF